MHSGSRLLPISYINLPVNPADPGHLSCPGPPTKEKAGVMQMGMLAQPASPLATTSSPSLLRNFAKQEKDRPLAAKSPSLVCGVYAGVDPWPSLSAVPPI
uniref:Uncharacterized protein n=1 Tax=Knipowitschia caucasica TaxID=637954 RepID=A0AAV2J7F5_KNICA